MTSPTQAAPLSTVSKTFTDPFGLPAQTTSPTSAFPSSNDPFGMSRPDDPFFTGTKSSPIQNPKLDDSDPFRPSDFSAAQESIKQAMANRSKTPGANMFGGTDFVPFANATTNRAQSATPWEPTRQAPPQPGSQALHDLFDVFR